MKTGIATVSIAGNLREKLAAIAAAGFDGLEIFEQDFLQDAANPREVGRMIRDHGLEVMLYQPFRDFEGLPATLRARAFDRARHKFDLMAELGAELMLICSSVHPQAMGGIDRAADDLAELAEKQEALRADMVARFSKSDARVAASQSTLDFLKSQIDVWNAQRN